MSVAIAVLAAIVVVTGNFARGYIKHLRLYTLDPIPKTNPNHSQLSP